MPGFLATFLVMASSRLDETYNFRPLDARVSTAGQPNEAQLSDAANRGVQVVINLALHDDPRYSLKDEAACVRTAGMEYVHIPVPFAAPSESDLLAFFDAMDEHRHKKVFVHCAANKRVTAFLGLYGVIRQGLAPVRAFAPMRSVWESDDVWKTFIERTLRNVGIGALNVRLVEQLSPEDAHRLFGWGENIFDTAHVNLVYRAKDPDDRRFILYDVQNAPASHAAVLTHHARANGKHVLIGGIGGVVTVPSARRCGYAALLVRHATDFLREEWKADFALLFCIDRMVPYYERLEWRKVTCDVLIDQPSGKLRCPFHVMTIPFTSDFKTIETIDLGSPSW